MCDDIGRVSSKRDDRRHVFLAFLQALCCGFLLGGAEFSCRSFVKWIVVFVRANAVVVFFCAASMITHQLPLKGFGRSQGLINLS